MADSKISALAAATALAGTEVVPIVQGGSTVRTTVQDIANLLASAVAVTSNNLSALSAAHTSLVDRVSANSGAGGGGSVTSAEYLSLVNRVSANSGVGGGGSVTSAEVVNAVSVEAANRTSADNVLSAAVAALSAQHTSLAGSVAGALSAIAANSAQMASADNAISNAVSIVSVAAAAASNAASNALSVANAASNKGSTLSVNLASVDGRVNSLQSSLSTVVSAVAANSAQMTSADNAISNAVSIVSVAVASLASVMSSRTSAIQANSAQMTSADNAISNAVSIVSVAAANAISGVNAVSQRLSALVLDSLFNVSAPSPTSLQVLKYNSAAAQWVASADATGGGGGSVTSNEASAISAAAASADNTLSVRIDSVFSTASHALSVANNAVSAASNYASVASQAASAASHYASVASQAASAASHYASVASNAASVASAAAVNVPWLAATLVQMSTLQSTNGSALVDISGLVVSVNAGDRWNLQGQFAYSTSAVSAGLRAGWSVPPLSTPRFGYFQMLTAAQSAAGVRGGGQLQVSGSSVYLSVPLAPAGSPHMVNFDFIMDVASAGTIRLQFGGINSTAQSPIHILPGAYIFARRLK